MINEKSFKTKLSNFQQILETFRAENIFKMVFFSKCNFLSQIYLFAINLNIVPKFTRIMF